MKTIVCGIDLSDQQPQLAEAAAAMAAALNARLLLAYALTANEAFVEAPSLDRMRAAARARLNDAAAKVSALVPAGVSTVLLEGKPAPQLVTLAQTENAVMLVLAAASHAEQSRLLLGSI